MSVTSIPTPPFTPIIPLGISPDSTLALLDDLVDFYQRERAWIQRTRDALDHAFESEGREERGVIHSSPTDSESTSNSECSEKKYLEKGSVSRWSERKKGFKLRLDNFPANYLSSPKPGRAIGSRSDLYQRKQVLDMLDKMMEARLESCEIVSQLVRDTACG